MQYYGTLVNIIGGPTHKEIQRENFWRMADGKSRMYLPFQVERIDGSGRQCNSYCFCPRAISENEARWLPIESEPPQLNNWPQFKCGVNLLRSTDAANAEDEMIWRLSGEIGLVKHGDGYIHELFVGEYDARQQKGAFFVLFEDEIYQKAKSFRSDLKFVPAPCEYDYETLINQLVLWS